MPASGKLLADGHGRVEAFGGMTGRHPDVDHDQVRALRADEGDEAVRVPGLAGDLESRSFQQSRYALAQQDIVVRQNDPYQAVGIAQITHPTM
jgi:ElaB/YqjD/DUF883 family membrane-anchored ribosome-binding protein